MYDSKPSFHNPDNPFYILCVFINVGNAVRPLYYNGKEGEFIYVNNIQIIYFLKLINIYFYDIEHKKLKIFMILWGDFKVGQINDIF